METLPSGLPKVVGDEEALARFLTGSGQFNTSGVHHSAFIPNPKDGKKSVYRHGREPLDELRKIAQERITSGKVYGAAICKAKQVREVGLDVVAEEPPLLHANIEGWPRGASDPDMEKAQQRNLAKVIAQHSEFVRF